VHEVSLDQQLDRLVLSRRARSCLRHPGRGIDTVPTSTTPGRALWRIGPGQDVLLIHDPADRVPTDSQRCRPLWPRWETEMNTPSVEILFDRGITTQLRDHGWHDRLLSPGNRGIEVAQLHIRTLGG